MLLSKKEITEFSEFGRQLAAAARSRSLPHFRSVAAVENKASAGFDPVTQADKQTESVITKMIAETYPDHGVLGEEFGARESDSPFRWIIDPVDGTRAFICGAPSWATLISLQYEGAPIVGLIDQPYTDECWLGASGATIFYRGEREHACRTSGLEDLSKARISTTDPRAGVYFNDHDAKAFGRLAGAARLARFGFDAYAYALLALGELDIVAETGLRLYDYAALIPVVEGAGGVVTNWRGEAVGADDRGEVLAAATPALSAAAIEALAR